jgi:molybdopterin-containing oxidoreductase family iron-sulfur binding subunit
MLDAVLAEFPQANWHQYEPVNHDSLADGAMKAFGRSVETTYDFSRAKTVLALDADFMTSGPGRVRYIADFADARDADAGHGMNRLYVAESSPTLTGANADHRAALKFSQVETLARVVALRVGVTGVDIQDEAANALPADYVSALVEDLQANKGAGIVLAGPEQPAIVHQLAHAINQVLGNTGATVFHREPVQARPENQTQSLASLTTAIQGGQVNVLLIVGGNPAYNAPADVNFAAALEGMTGRTRVHLTSHPNETSRLCDWAVPEAHFLEAWGDLRGHDGTVSIVQPVIHPLYSDAKSPAEFIAVLLGDGGAKGYDLVRTTWQTSWGENFDTQWTRALMYGIIDGTAAAPVQVSAQADFGTHTPPAHSELDILFRIDPAIYDGRWINNGWLMELPRPMTKHTWDNAVIMGPATAAAQGVGNEDVVTLTYGGRSVTGPVLIQFGHPEGAVTVHLGFGRTHTGKVGAGNGFNAYALRTSDSPWNGTGATIAPTGEKRLVARTEDHYLIEQSVHANRRHLIREATFGEWEKHPDFAAHMGHHAPADDFTLYDPKEKDFGGHQWAMTIDLNRCVGCNACVTACQSENNIPIVGKEQIAKGREMHWIRVDRYYKAHSEADFDQPEMAFQPLPCMQCENAPCEPVCPVGATMHSKEGLNDMVYNRCVGTRYCANNCPYKVRRFNFFHFNVREGQDRAKLALIRNPNVTVRSRGVMEKCTYCVQRINAARITAKKANRYIADGEVVTACQSACPAGAIVFGNINDENSAVTKLKANPRNYGLLADIGTRPRTSYLAKLRNPSAMLHTVQDDHGGNGNGHGGGHH